MTDNLLRVGKAIAGEGTSKESLEVYKKRYKELKDHWDDAEKKLKENNVDTNREPIYFGFIQWVEQKEIDGLPRLPGLSGKVEVPEDHFIQFYVAARIKIESQHIKLQNLAKTNFENWFLDIDGNAGAVILSKNGGGSGTEWVLTEAGDNKVRIQNFGNSKFKEWFLDIDGKNGELLLTKSAEGSGTLWALSKEGDKSKLQNLGTSKYKDFYLDIDGNKGWVVLSKGGSGTNWRIVEVK